MITELRIENFKSFGAGTSPLHLKPLNFIVGANASGKTNLVSALRFLKLAVMQNLDVAVAEFAGPMAIAHRAQGTGDQPEPIRFHVRIEGKEQWGMSGEGFQWDIRVMDYRVEIGLSEKLGAPEVITEELRVEQEDRQGVRKLFELSRTRSGANIKDELNPKGVRFIPNEVMEPNRLVIGAPFLSAQLIFLRNFIEGWEFFDIRPDVARMSYSQNTEQGLGQYGEELALALYRIEKENGAGALANIIAGLKGAVPGFKSVRSVQQGHERSFEVSEEHLRGSLAPGSVSDGTVRLLTMLVAAHERKLKSSLLVIEEPETGLHPHLSSHVMQLLRSISVGRQVIATTHSPAFLDELEPDEVILCDKIDGRTVVRTAADVEDINIFRKTFRLGELWNQGALGGTL